MASARQETLTVSAAPDEAFQGALGVVQNTKNFQLLAVHNQGRKLVAHEKMKMSNGKVFAVHVVGDGPKSAIKIVVDTDPRLRKAMMDGKFNQKSLTKFVQGVKGALDGSAPAPVTPVKNHYMQKKEQVPWTDPDQDPQIDLGFSWQSLAAEMGG